MANTVRILITAKDEISGQLDKIRDRASLLSKTDIGKGMLQGAGIAAFGMVKNAALGALDAVKDFAVGSIQAAAEEERGIARLTASLKANVEGWDGNTEAIERSIKAKLKSGFSDDAIRESLSRLVAVTHDVDKAFALQATAMDLARYKGISLEEASVALIKVEGGQYRALKELGIVLKAGASQTEALAAVQRVAGGQMAAYMETTAGKAELLGNKLDDLQEELGAKLTPAFTTATEKAIAFLDALDADADISLEDRLRGIADVANALNPAMWGLNATMGDLRKREAEAGEAAGSMVGNFGRIRKELPPTAHGFEDVSYWSHRAAKDLWGFSDALEGAVDAVIGASFDPEQLALQLRDVSHRLRDDQAELDKLVSKGKKSHDDWERILALRTALSDGKEETIRLKSKLAALDGLTLKEAQATVQALGSKLNWASKQGRELWRYMLLIDANAERAAGIVTGKSGNAGHMHAAGGSIPPYGWSIVGERGPELIRLGSSGASVLPTVGGAAGGGGSLTINVSTPVLTPGGAEALARCIAPSVTRWQQDRRLLGAR